MTTEAQDIVTLYETVLSRAIGQRAYRTLRDAVNEAAKVPELRRQMSETEWMLEGLRR